MGRVLPCSYPPANNCWLGGAQDKEGPVWVRVRPVVWSVTSPLIPQDQTSHVTVGTTVCAKRRHLIEYFRRNIPATRLAADGEPRCPEKRPHSAGCQRAGVKR